MKRPKRRARAYIPLTELLASALSMLLPQEERDAMRAARVPASAVIKLFTPDHIQLHTFGGKDTWENLDMKRRGPALKLKDNRDTSIAAKARRIDERWMPFTRAMASGTKPPKRISKWPKRKFQTKRKPDGEDR
jgi:hypothetical protein